MHEIESWLRGNKNWKVGLMLYSKYGRFKSVLTTFEVLGEGHATVKSLEEHLRKELAVIKDQIAQAVKEPIQPVPAPEGKTTAPPIAPGALQLEANKLYAQMGALHARLLAVDTNELRASLSADILKNQGRWASIMYQIDNPDVMVSEAEPLRKKQTNAKNLPGTEYQELINLRSKVTRAVNEQIPGYKAKLAKKEDKNIREKLNAREAEVAAWKKRIKELETVTNG